MSGTAPSPEDAPKAETENNPSSASEAEADAPELEPAADGPPPVPPPIKRSTPPPAEEAPLSITGHLPAAAHVQLGGLRDVVQLLSLEGDVTGRDGHDVEDGHRECNDQQHREDGCERHEEPFEKSFFGGSNQCATVVWPDRIDTREAPILRRVVSRCGGAG